MTKYTSTHRVYLPHFYNNTEPYACIHTSHCYTDSLIILYSKDSNVLKSHYVSVLFLKSVKC